MSPLPDVGEVAWELARDDVNRVDAQFVAVINESLARASFPNDDPIGKRIRCGLDSLDYMTIVGVVADVRTRGPASPVQPEIYMPHAQHPGPGSSLNIVTILLYAQIRGDVLHDPNLGYALALGMILITGLSNGLYIWLRQRSERWLR